MAVTVYFDDGAQEFFPEASAATSRGPLVVICKWDPARKRLDDFKTFGAGEGVTVVEVVRDGVAHELPPRPPDLERGKAGSKPVVPPPSPSQQKNPDPLIPVDPP